jgi:hypothetical protein
MALGSYQMYDLRRRVSSDGISWERRDAEFGLNPAPDGWDFAAIAYPYVIDVGGQLLMFYNGNDLGASGMGYAVAER